MNFTVIISDDIEKKLSYKSNLRYHPTRSTIIFYLQIIYFDNNSGFRVQFQKLFSMFQSNVFYSYGKLSNSIALICPSHCTYILKLFLSIRHDGNISLDNNLICLFFSRLFAQYLTYNQRSVYLTVKVVPCVRRLRVRSHCQI